MLIELDGALFGYGPRAVVRIHRLALAAGRCLGVFGPNGAGKSTLVRGLAGLLPPMEGAVRRQRQDLRFGYLPQHRAIDPHWPMTGFDAASLAVSAARPLGWIGSEAAGRVRESMRLMGVEPLASHPFAKLSGGQQQRLLLAGALATAPEILILDEPTEGLDVRSRQALLDLLHAQNRRGLCTVMISHAVEDLLYVADDIAWLHPCEDTRQPTEVEIISSDALRERVTKARRAS
ncbi:MAG TPA: ATP-binding cassette domain-containing protein [Tepidisphaeraceae bacterium]|nr:ATP-binding cassette domain-containing protein [Tepidisphaeraceae bacterium]